MATPSRIQLARRRLRVARYSIGAVALTAFAAFGFAVRDAHPATRTSASTATAGNTSTASSSTDDSSTNFGGSASISPAPQTAAPQLQSSGS
jgi:hypothetical protein